MRKVIDWNRDWLFVKGSWQDTDVSSPIDEQVKADGTGFTCEKVNLPHTWYTDEDYYQGEAVYQKKFEYIKSKDTRTYIKFYGVDKVCRIYLNGTEIGGHEGGYNIFALELTDALITGTNLLTVLVSTDKKLHVSPISGDFAVFGGIHRKVELVETGVDCFDTAYYGCDGVIVQTRVSEDGKGEVWGRTEISLTDENKKYKVRYSLTNNGKESLSNDHNSDTQLFSKTYSIEELNRSFSNANEISNLAEHKFTLEKVLELDSPIFWNGLDDAHLYTMTVSLLADGEEVDSVTKEVGFRRIAMDADKGFFLNGEHVKLHGVAKHQDSCGVFSAATMDNWKEDMGLIHEIGANAVRFSHYPHPQEVYSLCDSMGFVVWAEIPMLKLPEDDELFENAKVQLKEMILQNMHHPSICFWGIQNEIAIYGEFPYMAEKMHVLNDLAHELDGTRFSTCANLNVVHSDSTLNQVTDTTAYNIYYGWYYGEFADHGKFLDEFHKVNPAMPLGISEYGADTNTAYHSDDPKVNDYSEEFQALYHETVYPMMAQRDFVWGSFVWNMFDFTSPVRGAANIKKRNIKGLVTFDRKTRKDSFYYYKAMWSKDPFVSIAGKRYVNRAYEAMTVKVYSNQESVTLEAAGKEYIERTVNGSAVFKDIPLTMGKNKIVARAGEVSDHTIFNRVEEPDKSYVYVDQNPGLNVRNWFLDEESEAQLFPEGYLSIRSTINDLLASKEATAVIDKRMPDVGKELRDMVGTFTLEKFFFYAKPDYTEEEMKALNAELTKIKA